MKKNEIKLSDHMTYKKLLKFTFPSICMMVFTSIYSIVDGFFISNFAGKTAFAAINLMMPAIMLVGGLGFMMGTGGAALVGKTLGEQNPEKANKIFSSIVYFTIISLATFVFHMPSELSKILYAVLIVLALCLPMIKEGIMKLWNKIFKKKTVEVK